MVWDRTTQLVALRALTSQHSTVFGLVDVSPMVAGREVLSPPFLEGADDISYFRGLFGSPFSKGGLVSAEETIAN